MRPPIGILAIVIYLCFDCVISLGYVFLDLRWFGLHRSIVWLDLLYGLGFGLIAWGLFRLKEWARFIAMLAIALWAGARLPLYLAHPRHLDFSYFLIVTEEIIDVFAVWYLFRFATAKYFSKPEKTT